MKKTLLLFISMLLCTALRAQEVIFFDNFDDGNFNGWAVFDDPEPRSGPSEWVVENGILRQKSNIWAYDPPAEFLYHLGSHVSSGDKAWTDYSLNAILRSTDNDGIGIIFRYQDEQNYYRILLMNDAGNSGSVGSAVQRIQRFVDGEPRTLHQNIVTEAYPSGFFSLTADVRGDSIKAYLNGELIGAVRDSIYDSGKIGLFVYANSGAYFDSVMVSSDPFIYDEPDIEYTYPVSVDRMPYIQRPTTESAEIAWRTVQPFIGKVEIGLEKGVYTRSLTEAASTQKHHVVIDQLQADTRYFYRVSNGSTVILEDESFKTAKPDEMKQLSFLVLGDSGVNTDIQRAVNNQMLQSHNADAADFLIHVGDVHQGDGSSYDDIYFSIYEELLKQMNFYLSIGNHDTYTDDAAPYLDDFYLPRNNPEQSERYYSYRWANAYFIVLDSNIDMAPGSAQYTFLLNELQSDRQQTADWTFVYFHHPPYCEFWPAWDGDPVVRQHLMPVFEDYDVDMVLNGHTHAYEKGELNGVTYVISGGGGGGLDAFARDFEHITISEGVHHYSRIDIDGLELKFKAVDMNGNLVDEFTITKSVLSSEEESESPNTIQLKQNYPNPFNPSTTIEFELNRAAEVQLEVFDATGRRVARLTEGFKSSGRHSLEFDATGLASGVYVYRLTAGNRYIEKTMTLIK
jgi:hypothetical protein